MRRGCSNDAPVLIGHLWHGTEIVQDRGHGVRFVVQLAVAIVELCLLPEGPAAAVAVDALLLTATGVVRAGLGPESAGTPDGERAASGGRRVGQGGVGRVCRSMVASDLSLMYLCGALQVFTNGRQ